jgi:hypothetical protein
MQGARAIGCLFDKIRSQIRHLCQLPEEPPPFQWIALGTHRTNVISIIRRALIQRDGREKTHPGLDHLHQRRFLAIRPIQNPNLTTHPLFPLIPDLQPYRLINLQVVRVDELHDALDDSTGCFVLWKAEMEFVEVSVVDE